MAGYISYGHKIKLDGRQTVVATSPSIDARDDSTLVQQVLSSEMEKAEQWQYHELFETKFVVKDRACRTIIDSESCNNFVSSDLVEKLELPTQPHPQPYYIKWFNSCGKFKASENNQGKGIHNVV
uniref:Retrotransposon protein, putative, Ty3-gypsy subclass n=2 Tax=Oryza sativa subsp. japonica TaxID=39947 RepID=Q53K49_ORYSJ|nr:retrotransposon protein, putative, Ty3-gypsy sub-class [Oryza sativa Japonica Group]ABA93184.1 retrotransposon protein, putative, Ty3-gypsy subclass [Oryza sativa Japonica Group]